MRPDRFCVCCLAVCGLAIAPVTNAAAQSLDPTRPPDAPTIAGPASTTHAVAQTPPAPPRLQSVQLPREGRPSALVDGRLMFVGDKLGQASVTAIDARGLRLRHSNGSVEHMALLDAQVEMQPVLASRDAPSPAAGLLAKGK